VKDDEPAAVLRPLEGEAPKDGNAGVEEALGGPLEHHADVVRPLGIDLHGHRGGKVKIGPGAAGGAGHPEAGRGTFFAMETRYRFVEAERLPDSARPGRQ
jgi:hypothetical protein